MRTSVVIATQRRPELLRETLEALTRCDPPAGEIVVVDGDEGGSAGPVVRSVSALQGAGAIRHLPSPPGLTVQRNRGVDAAAGDVVVFLDDDVLVDPGLLGALAAAFEDPSVVGATGRVLEDGTRRFGNARSRLRRLVPGGGAEGSMTRFGYPRRLQTVSEARDVETMEGCLMSARREIAARLRFDEKMAGYALAEDEDFAYRLSRLGRVRYLPDAVLRHRNAGFSSSDARAFNRMVVVNRAYLFRKNFEQTPLARLQFGMLLFGLAVHRALNREWRGLRGLFDGALQAWRDGRTARGRCA